MERGKKKSPGKRVLIKTIMRPATETVRKVDCCPGYKKVGPKKICTPKCDQVCENSKCTAPNECSCNDGYKKFTANRCIPECENCERGLCVGPNICQCYHGYDKNESGQCVPTCQDACVNGWCSAPNVCTCHEGYELDKNIRHKCNPICKSSCIQGRCIAPDVCDCYPGYEFKNGSKTECLPVCDFCESGNCTGPSNCTCWDNYEEHIIVQGEKVVKVCQPKCENECVNGICIEVDTCACKTGFEFVKDSIDVCEPVCEPPCYNGICESPNTCLCDPGYENVDQQCIPHCEHECVNGVCVNPNQCECWAGYTSKLNSINQCEAFCDNCTNGICIEPNNCKCLDGFLMTDNNYCEKLCVPECISGKCVNGYCGCEHGFQLFNQSICLPLEETSTEAIHSPSAPDNDECNKNDNCDNVCGDDNECTNGTTCVLQGTQSVCVALEETTTETIQSTPPFDNVECNGNCDNICGDVKDNCTNGTCVLQGKQSICVQSEESTTEAIQSPAPFNNNECNGNCDNVCGDGTVCINGTCILTGMCECFEGFQLDPFNPSLCVRQQTTSAAIIVNYISFITAFFIIVLMGTIFIFLLNRRSCKVNYNVDEKERKIGVKWENNVHYVINKDDHAFA
ncbi:Epidermal growth factor-like protein [Pseudolycoriella hygida]|uniref:Epidermal growth factor-like protein n=1 Tax=Pseudolycoriella hygida TaxID=35572 RepID=A0A9Q0NBX3_9DIPT|nr:Epidermal growth factor-like protein [Pseudolycoriella hygida]